MLYGIKKRIIIKSIKKRNKDLSFDYNELESFKIEKDFDPLINNSYYFSAHNDNTSIYLRLGERSNINEVWVFIKYNNKCYSLKKELFGVSESPLSVKKENDKFIINFYGLLSSNTIVSLNATFRSTNKIINFSTDMREERMAVSMAEEKWNKLFFKELDNVKGQTHLEQEGILEGTFSLDGDKIPFSLPCLRDHSFGERDWNYMNNHLWLMGISDKGAFNYSLVSYPVLTLLEVGNYRYDSDNYNFLLSSTLKLDEISNSIIPKELSFRVKLDNKKTINVSAKVLNTVSYSFDSNKYILHENIAEFTIDNNKFMGILEIGFNKDKKRIFNGKKLSGLKRK